MHGNSKYLRRTIDSSLRKTLDNSDLIIHDVQSGQRFAFGSEQDVPIIIDAASIEKPKPQKPFIPSREAYTKAQNKMRVDRSRKRKSVMDTSRQIGANHPDCSIITIIVPHSNRSSIESYCHIQNTTTEQSNYIGSNFVKLFTDEVSRFRSNPIRAFSLATDPEEAPPLLVDTVTGQAYAMNQPMAYYVPVNNNGESINDPKHTKRKYPDTGYGDLGVERKFTKFSPTPK